MSSNNLVEIKRENAVAKYKIDGLVNVATGLGTAKSKLSHSMWELESLVNGFQQLDAAYQSNWIARQVVDVPAEDMTREWRSIKSEGAEEIKQLEDELDITGKVQEAITWARLYGGSGMLLLTGQDLTKPLNINKIKKGDLKRVIVFDRWDLSAMTLNVHNILARNYLQPEFYTIVSGAQQIHWSHVVRFEGANLPRRQMVQTHGWGDSELRKCMADIKEMVAAKGGIAELMQEANIDIITREGLNDDLASDQDEAIIKRYEMFSLMKSCIQMGLLDDNEKFERKELSLSGVAPILEVFMTWISGCADIPLTRLFGTSAKGMNATGDGDMQNYHNSIRSKQTTKLAPSMNALDQVLVRSALGHYPDDYAYVWNPLEQINEVEAAQAQQLRASKDQIYLDAGVVTKSQIQRNLQSSNDYQFDDEQIEQLEELEDGNMFDEPLLPEIDLTADANFNNGFVSVRPDLMTAHHIAGHLKELGIEDFIDPTDMHVTVMYSRNDEINTNADPKRDYIATVTNDVTILGEHPYRALVLKLDSDDLQVRHGELFMHGGIHSFDDYLPHLSLKYNVTDEDLRKLRENPIQIGKLILSGETFRPVDVINREDG